MDACVREEVFDELVVEGVFFYDCAEVPGLSTAVGVFGEGGEGLEVPFAFIAGEGLSIFGG